MKREFTKLLFYDGYCIPYSEAIKPIDREQKEQYFLDRIQKK